MINTANKPESLRTARARATVLAGAAARRALAEGSVPKGNVLELARAAGILAAKRTPELIPLCHPLPLDQVTVDFELTERGVEVTSTVVVTARTGVEMEALTAVSVAALTIYDMLKPLDKELEITGVKLVEKRGGKSDFKSAGADVTAAVIVVSDRVSQGKMQDETGAALRACLDGRGVRVTHTRVVPDEAAQIAAAVRESAARGCSLVLTAGGTGLGPRDVTVEAVRPLLEREAPGIPEAMRAHGTRRHPYAMLSRGVVGLVGTSLVVTLPGSPRGAVESLEPVFPALLHALAIAGGAGH
ncbi:MAG: bifunctional molybdenum cofactor biosynthesis protein MoaC/MoaB [Candidatus Eisenbacteria bacterium]|nr:bifunctional molybdenum cofactor biosynthesis protein MoaC/MoaB [Candidatus Eisenbacteria bacterium]